MAIAIGTGVFIYSQTEKPPTASPNTPLNMTNDTEAIPAETIIATELDTPWSIVVLDDKNLLVTERQGSVVKISPDGSKKTIANISQVKEIGEGGLLGMTVHPNFLENNYIYFYYTYSENNNNTQNRVVRMTYENDTLTNETIIVDAIPGASNHNGGQIAFGPDKFLYITTGDAQEPSEAQNTNSLAGKILRVTDEGKPAPGNPFDNEVYSYGHRNPQGLSWDAERRLWSTEHGRSGVLSGLDELNIIEAGKNYGWPEIQGNETKEGMQVAKLNSGNTTWAPAAAAFTNNAVYFGGLRGQTLYKAELGEGSTVTITNVLENYGRIRAVTVDEGAFYTFQQAIKMAAVFQKTKTIK